MPVVSFGVNDSEHPHPHMEPTLLRIAVFDSQSVVHKGLSSLLPGQGHSLVSQALDGRDAVNIVRESLADLVLTEIHMPHVNGIGLLEQIDIANLDIPVLVYTSDDNPTFVARAVVHGARDYVLKSATVAKLLLAINNAGRLDAADKTPLFVTIRNQLQKRDGMQHRTLDLTSREWQVLRHLGLGLSNREIAKSLEISVETVKEHVQNILRKLNAKDRTAAAVRAVKDGLV